MSIRRSSKRRITYRLSAALVAMAVAAQTGAGLTISQRGVDLIMDWESCRGDVYRDPIGLATAGCGSLVQGDEYAVGQVLSKTDVRDLFVDDLGPFVVCVRRAVDPLETDQHEFDALVSLAFNIGCGAFRRSTALRRHNAGDEPGAAKALQWWNKAGGLTLRGLVNRRKAEASLYLNQEAS